MSLVANKEVVRRMIEEAWNAGNLAVVDELLAGDAIDHHDPDEPSFAEHMKEQIVNFHRAFPDFRFTIEDMVAEGDKVAFRSTLTGTQQGEFNGIPSTGRRMEMAQMHIVRVVDGKGVDHWAVFDMLGVLQQLGVIPQRPPVPAGR
jgi:steroid delta-isomerase-like uncharacterized protein